MLAKQSIVYSPTILLLQTVTKPTFVGNVGFIRLLWAYLSDSVTRNGVCNVRILPTRQKTCFGTDLCSAPTGRVASLSLYQEFLFDIDHRFSVIQWNQLLLSGISG